MSFSSGSLILPFVDFSTAPQWDWWLINSDDMSQIMQLNAHGKNLQLQLDNQGKASCWLHLFDEASEFVVPHQTGIRCDRNGETVWSGAIWQTNETSSVTAQTGTQSGGDQNQITAFGWFNIFGGSGDASSGNSRLVHTGQEFLNMMYINGTDPSGGLQPNYAAWIAQNNGVPYSQLGVDTAIALSYSTTTNPNTSDAAIIFDLVNRANIDWPTLVTPGNIYGIPYQRNVSLQRFQVAGEEIITLVNTEGGVDFVIDPVTRKMHLYGPDASQSPLIPNGYGTDRGSGCVFTLPGNCISATRNRDGTQTQNRIEAIGEYSVGRADDLTSQSEYGLFEAQDSLSEVVDPNILIAYAQAEVQVRKNPWTIVTFTPRAIKPEDYGSVPSVPRIFDDYTIGDIVYCYVNRGSFQVGTSNAPQACRVFGATIDISDDGTERVSSISTTYQGLGGS